MIHLQLKNSQQLLSQYVLVSHAEVVLVVLSIIWDNVMIWDQTVYVCMYVRNAKIYSPFSFVKYMFICKTIIPKQFFTAITDSFQWAALIWHFYCLWYNLISSLNWHDLLFSQSASEYIEITLLQPDLQFLSESSAVNVFLKQWSSCCLLYNKWVCAYSRYWTLTILCSNTYYEANTVSHFIEHWWRFKFLCYFVCQQYMYREYTG